MTTPAPPQSSRRENVFTRKIGPLPMWGWLLIGVALVGVYVIYEYRKKNQSASSTSASSTGATTGATTSASQVPQFVNQTYTYSTAPSSSSPPAGNQAHKNWKGSGKPTTGTGTGGQPTSGGSSGSTGSQGGGLVGQTLQAVNAALSQRGISTAQVYVAGQSTPLPNAQATVPYAGSTVTNIVYPNPTQAVLYVTA